MIQPEEKAKFERIESLTAWDVAREYHCYFSGDCNPLEHGGFFYDARDWESCGWAACVEFWHDPENDCLVIQRGTIHKPNDKDMKSAFRCCDIPSEERGNIHAQIEACRFYCGIEPDGTCYPALKSFRLEDWKEWRIWRSIDGWLRFLGD